MHRIMKNEMNIQKQSTHHSRLNKHVEMDLFLLRIQKQQQILLVSSDLDALTKCNSFAVNINMPCALKTSDYVCVCVCGAKCIIIILIVCYDFSFNALLSML